MKKKTRTQKGLWAESIIEARTRAKKKYPKMGKSFQEVMAMKEFSGAFREGARKKAITSIAKFLGG